MKEKAQKYWQRKIRSRGKADIYSFLFTVVLFLLMQVSIFSAVLDVNMDKAQDSAYVNMFLTVFPGEEVSGVQVECIYDANTWEMMSVYPDDLLSAVGKELQFANAPGNLRILIIGFNNYPIPSGRLLTIQFHPIATEANVLGFKIVQVKFSSPQALPVSGTVSNNDEAETSSTENTTTDTTIADTIDSSDSSSSPALSDVGDTTIVKNLSSEVYPSQSTASDKGASQDLVNSTTATSSNAQKLSATTSYSTFSPGYMPENEEARVLQNNANAKSKTKAETTLNPSSNPKIVIPVKMSQTQIVSQNNMSPYLNNFSVKSQAKSSIKPMRNLQPLLKESSDGIAFAIPENISSKSHRDSLFRYPTTLENQFHNKANLALNISNIPQTRGRNKECLNTEVYNTYSNIPQNESSLIFFVTLIIVSMIILSLITVLTERKILFVGKKTKRGL